MGFDMHGAFERGEEWKAARLDTIEFEEIARALKAVAAEHDQPSAPLIDLLAAQGVAEALRALARTTGADVAADYWRCRAQVRGV